MSFRSILGSILSETRCGLGIALMGTDGIPIEQVQGGAAARAVLGDDVGTAGAEFGRILDQIRKAADVLGGGAIQETVVSLTRFSLIFRAVDEELFVVLALGPDGNLGKARYLIRRHLAEIREEL
jgi:predicted regulator of Ras-like GTPase activity (Roadblock/LC7/MglB family)